MSTLLAPTTTPLDALEFAPGCEHRNHQADPDHHQGQAEWMLTVNCANCNETTTGFICNPWRETVSDWTRFGVLFWCPKCGRANPKTTISITRI